MLKNAGELNLSAAKVNVDKRAIAKMNIEILFQTTTR